MSHALSDKKSEKVKSKTEDGPNFPNLSPPRGRGGPGDSAREGTGLGALVSGPPQRPEGRARTPSCTAGRGSGAAATRTEVSAAPRTRAAQLLWAQPGRDCISPLTGWHPQGHGEAGRGPAGPGWGPPGFVLGSLQAVSTQVLPTGCSPHSAPTGAPHRVLPTLCWTLFPRPTAGDQELATATHWAEELRVSLCPCGQSWELSPHRPSHSGPPAAPPVSPLPALWAPPHPLSADLPPP